MPPTPQNTERAMLAVEMVAPFDLADLIQYRGGRCSG
jgi:hypothetical protein